MRVDSSTTGLVVASSRASLVRGMEIASPYVGAQLVAHPMHPEALEKGACTHGDGALLDVSSLRHDVSGL